MMVVVRMTMRTIMMVMGMLMIVAMLMFSHYIQVAHSGGKLRGVRRRHAMNASCASVATTLLFEFRLTVVEHGDRTK